MSTDNKRASSNKPSEVVTHSQRLEALWNLLGPLLALICVIVFFAVADMIFADGTFASWRNLRTVLVQTCVVAIAALGMTLIIISKGIDLSAGTALALCATTLAWGLREDVAYRGVHWTNFANASVALQEAQEARASLQGSGNATKEQLAHAESNVDARRQRLLVVARHKLAQLKAAAEGGAGRKARADLRDMQDRIQRLEGPQYQLRVDPAWLRGVPNSPWSAPLAVLIGVGTGLLAGFLNGLLITRLRVVPFIVTLGTASIYLGLGNLLSENVPIRPGLDQVPGWISGIVSNRADALYLGFPLGIWLLVVLSVIVALLLRFTVFGRHVFAVGSNEATARLCGINVTATQIAVYTLGGTLIGMAGFCYFGRLSTGNPTAGVGMELDIIAAVTIGGGSLMGGRGTVLGTLTGALTVAVIASGCTQLGLPDPIQLIAVGAAIVGAAAIDRWRQGGDEE
jgi:ribose/xylose/arabinose/galactoside ABC-type transport system permease subunit